MENKVVTLKIESNLNSITKDVKKLGNTFEDTADEIKGIQQSTKSAESGVKSLSDGFKGMGLAVKAIGIGLVMEAFNLFKEILGKNQKVVDLFNTAIGALSIAFNDLIGFVSNNFPAVIKIFKDVFENPTKYLQKFGDLVKENLIERFNSFLDTLGFVSEAIKKVFEGDFSGAMDSVKKAGKESLDVLTGVNDSFDKGKKIVSDAAEAIGNYAVKTFKASEANVKLQNSAILAAAEQGRLVEQYDRQAEKLRQIRDNDLLSIDDRIEANNKLSGVLEKQQKAMLSQASLQVAAAQATYNMNKSIENQAAVTDALANKEGVLAQIEGLRSENISNNISLQKEKIALGQSEIENLNALQIEQKKFNESLETDELKKLENQRANLEEEKTIELARLQLKIDSAVLGTQARVDAENEYAVKKQEIDNALTTNLKANAEAQKVIDDKLAEAKVQNLQRGSAMLSQISDLVGKNTAAGKVAAVASATIDTYSAAQSAFKNAQLNPISIIGPAYPYISAGLAIAGGLKNVQSILAVKTPSGGGGSAPSGGGMGSGPTAPAFNVVGASSTNQLAQTIGSKEQQPIKAYVVANDVTTQQGLDRNIVQSASIG